MFMADICVTGSVVCKSVNKRDSSCNVLKELNI